MIEQLWSDVDHFFCDRLAIHDGILESILEANRAAELPAIDVSPALGRFLYLQAKIMHAKRVLEVGTLGGYSSICLARALPADGQLVTLELEPHHAEVARRNFASAGVSEKIELKLGDALSSLNALREAKAGPFDLVFIDADKERCADYLDLAIQLSRPGGLIIVDNVVREGEVVNAHSEDTRVQGVRRMIDAIAHDRRMTVTALQTVGTKGYDGFVLAVVN